MKNFDENIINSYNLLIDTLIMSSPDFDIISDTELEEYLEELEGDYYAFLHDNNVQIFVKMGLLTTSEAAKIVQVRALIENIVPELWKINSFKVNEDWIRVHALAKEIRESLGVKKGKIDNEMVIPHLRIM